MLRKIILFRMYFLFLSQVVDPNGTVWDFKCMASEPFDTTGFATAYYNDSDQDCISNDFLINFHLSDGSIDPYTNVDWLESEPGSGGYYNFDSSFWGCCSDSDYIGGSGGSGGSGGADSCPCVFTIDETAFLSVECPDPGNC